MRMQRIRGKLILLLSLVVIAAASIGKVSYAYLQETGGSVTNAFSSATVSCEVVGGSTTTTSKDSIQVENTGSAAAYIRVKLFTYWVNDQNQIVGYSSAALSPKIDTENWISTGENVYYCKEPVAAATADNSNNITPNLLAEGTSIQLEEKDGYKQVLEIHAQAVQALPATAAEEIWHVTIQNNEIEGAAK